MSLSVFSSIIPLLLLLGCHSLQSLPETWPDHYHTVEKNGDVIISCPLEAEIVLWSPPETCGMRFSNQKTQVLRRVDMDCAGKYTCSYTDDRTRHANVVVLLHSKNSLTSSITCKADSYKSSELVCTSTEELMCPCLVRAKAVRGNFAIPWDTTSFPSENIEQLKFSVPLSSSPFCLYGEHGEAFSVHVEIMTLKEHWRVEKKLTMVDAVVPGAPENLKVDDSNISWEYPSSWPQPHSYFPLLFRVEVKKKKKENHTMETLSYSKINIREFRVQCRDLFNPSASWSPWSKTFRL